MSDVKMLVVAVTNGFNHERAFVAWSVANGGTDFRTLEDRNRFRPRMFSIVHNVIVGEYRKRSVRPTEIRFQQASYAGEDCDGHEFASLLLDQLDDILLWRANPERRIHLRPRTGWRLWESVGCSSTYASFQAKRRVCCRNGPTTRRKRAPRYVLE